MRKALGEQTDWVTGKPRLVALGLLLLRHVLNDFCNGHLKKK